MAVVTTKNAYTCKQHSLFVPKRLDDQCPRKVISHGSRVL